MICLFQLTKYPHLYRHTLWGRLIEREDGDSEIFKNRNKFAEDRPGIKSVLPSKVPNYVKEWVQPETPGAYFSDVMNHPEFYYDGNVFHVVVSSYIPDASQLPIFRERGFEQVPNLYSQTATTFVKAVPKREKNAGRPPYSAEEKEKARLKRNAKQRIIQKPYNDRRRDLFKKALEALHNVQVSE